MSKGVFCLEGLWDNDLKNKSSVLPILELLERRQVCDFIYHDCATREELEFYLKRWKQKSISSKYPILYLAFHGSRECLYINNRDCEYSLEELGTILESACERKIIFFASCETLDIHGKKANKFLEQTDAIGIIGYKQKVNWIDSTAFELLVLNALQGDTNSKEFYSKDLINIEERIKTDYKDLQKSLDFRVLINKKKFSKRRKSKVVPSKAEIYTDNISAN